jgi:alpha-beta hydrolase superfamily lysophospholipase
MDAAIEPSETAGGTCTFRQFCGKKIESPDALGALLPDSQAGLRQFSLERMMGYGIDYADAIEFRAKVLEGQGWRDAAADMAARAISSAEGVGQPLAASQATLYYRASALLRMSQALMLQDTDERREIVERAVDCYVRSATLRKDRRHVHIETAGGPMAGWFLAAQGPAAGSVIVIGGVEGWAMDFDCIGEALAKRRLNALMLDAPGQGETRLIHRHYLSARWLESFRRAIDFAEQTLPDRPIGIIGNSMGGAIALAVANNDTRIAACCNNGGMIRPSEVRGARATLFAKMVAFCGISDEDQAAAVWDTVQPVKPGPNTSYCLLVLQGGLDPLVSVEHGKMFMAQTPARGKRMELFSDGDHCLYNHRTDRDILVADWMRARLDG